MTLSVHMGLRWWHQPWYAQESAGHGRAAVEEKPRTLAEETLPVVPSHLLNGNLRPAEAMEESARTPKGDKQVLSFNFTCTVDVARVRSCQYNPSAGSRTERVCISLHGRISLPLRCHSPPAPIIKGFLHHIQTCFRSGATVSYALCRTDNPIPSSM